MVANIVRVEVNGGQLHLTVRDNDGLESTFLVSDKAQTFQPDPQTTQKSMNENQRS